MRGAEESARLAALEEHRPGPGADDRADLDAVVRLAAALTGAPVVSVNLLDAVRQCHLSTVGPLAAQTPVEDSLCAVAFRSGDLVHVPDARLHPVHRHNPHVDGRLASMRLYASAPLVTADGHALGTLCVFDPVARALDEHQLAGLRDLAGVAASLLERRRQARRAHLLAAEADEQRSLAELMMGEAERREELTQAVLATVDVGIVVAGPDGRLVTFNDTARAMLGRDADGGLDLAGHAGAYGLRTEDGARPLRPEELPLHRTLREGSVQGARVRIAVPGRAPVTATCSGRTVRAADGTVLGAVVALHDVTALQAREAALRATHAELAAAHEQLGAHAARVEALARASAAVATADEPRAAVCEAARELCGADAAYLAQPGPDGVLATTATVGLEGVSLRLDPCRDTSLVLDAYLGRGQLFEPDVPAHPRASRAVVEACGTVSAVWQPVLRRGREPVGVLALIWRRRVEALAPGVAATLATLAGEAAHALERAELLERLERAAEHDALTGLPNRRRWDAVAAAEVARAARTGAPLTFALLDLDRFKLFNDTRGHLEGDALLREFAAAASSCLREVDTLARWGGEEFVLALPGCDEAGAVAVADRIRAAVPRGQSCTVGVARWSPGRSAAEVLADADAALYRGKQAGRDATVTC
ncbi:sensor domain-containing diguanylate cyclase [Kineococcus sp. SYSU DK005]|uniref:sensor domain-containing diguanylate cyclase n=1 Tax=Kineococcus sp. SYSU DK005 TaxID=3383126 RepID=UPI003D7D381E